MHPQIIQSWDLEEWDTLKSHLVLLWDTVYRLRNADVCKSMNPRRALDEYCRIHKRAVNFIFSWRDTLYCSSFFFPGLLESSVPISCNLFQHSYWSSQVGFCCKFSLRFCTPLLSRTYIHLCPTYSLVYSHTFALCLRNVQIGQL